MPIAELLKDKLHQALQAFIPSPAKSQVNSAMTGTVVFKVGAGGTVDISDWLALKVDPTYDGSYYYNSDNTKTYPLRAGVDNIIFVGQLLAGNSVTLLLDAGTASIQGM